jgi:hypothetical protein
MLLEVWNYLNQMLGQPTKLAPGHWSDYELGAMKVMSEITYILEEYSLYS